MATKRRCASKVRVRSRRTTLGALIREHEQRDQRAAARDVERSAARDVDRTQREIVEPAETLAAVATEVVQDELRRLLPKIVREEIKAMEAEDHYA